MKTTRWSLLRGALIGGVGGLVASYAMDSFQEAVALSLPPSSGDDPSTVKLAERLLGREIPDDEKPGAGAQVHYAFGVVLGIIYGVVSEVEPRINSGFGLPFGASVAVVADEMMVPALGLSPPPWQSPLATHAYSLASHLVFGAVLEAGRRVLVRVS